jgi:hypothetical protein
MSKRARMIDLAEELFAPEDRVHDSEQREPVRERAVGGPITNIGPAPRLERPPRAGAIEIDRPYGERGDFEKVTVTLPSDVRALILDESLRRKKRRSADWPIAAIVREAIASYLTRKGE